jgi:hypothetical protein
MDARKHLRGLGWQGEGHSLGKNGGGLKKPLLITHKTGLHGLGAKSQREKQADQWWLNAFDNALKDMGTGKESSLSKIKDNGAGRGGLYGYFVRGGGLEGTFDSGESTGASTPVEVHRAMNTTVMLSVKELNAAGSLKEAKHRKKDKKEKREPNKKSKKRKLEEDPVDSHQDEPEAKRLTDKIAIPEVAEPIKVRKSKKKYSEVAQSGFESERQADEVAQVDNMRPNNEANAEQLRVLKAERRRAKGERRARKEEKRRIKLGSGRLKEEVATRQIKKEKNNLRTHQTVK